MSDLATANARTLGSRQVDAVQQMTGQFYLSRGAYGGGPDGVFGGSSSGSGVNGSAAQYPTTLTRDLVNFDSSRSARTSEETRALNAAYAPRIHV